MKITPIHSTELYSFMIVVMLMIVSPGANQVLVLQSGITLGPKAAAFNVLGIASSMFIHASLSGLGISLLIMQSPGLHSFIKIIGAGYVVYLACISLVNAYRLRKIKSASEIAAAALTEPVYETSLKSFAKGFTTNVLNIQTSFIFLSIFPQYMNQQHSLFYQSFFLTIVFVLLLLSWYSLVVALIAKVRYRLLDPYVQMWVKGITGSLLFIMGIRMVLR